jgi:hypothetical protein
VSAEPGTVLSRQTQRISFLSPAASEGGTAGRAATCLGVLPGRAAGSTTRPSAWELSSAVRSRRVEDPQECSRLALVTGVMGAPECHRTPESSASREIKPANTALISRPRADHI